MSDDIKHECGVAIVRLKQPLAYYRERHGTPLWGLKKLYLLMEKQRNRGQDGAGLGVLKQHSAPGSQYFHRQREAGPNSLDRLWRHVHDDLARLVRDLKIGSADETALMRHYPWLGELYLGHLRYGTHGGNSTEVCHPYVRASNWRSRYLSVAGNFNLTNTEEIFGMLVKMGQHPIGSADTSTVMEKIGHFLDVANEALVRRHAGKLDGDELAKRIGDELDLARVLRKAARAWDGGYFMIGAVGHGAAFALRDPNGIRPGYWYEDDEVVAVASERTALVTCFNVRNDQVREVTPGAALVINHQPVEGRWASEVEILPPGRAPLVHLRAHLLQPRQRRRHLPRAQGARPRAGAGAAQGDRLRPRARGHQLHPEHRGIGVLRPARGPRGAPRRVEGAGDPAPPAGRHPRHATCCARSWRCARGRRRPRSRTPSCAPSSAATTTAANWSATPTTSPAASCARARTTWW